MVNRTRIASVLLMMAGLGNASWALADDVRMFVRHHVLCYATWHRAYANQGTRDMQKKGGVIDQSVYQSLDDPNDVTVIHDFHSLEAAKAFAASPELKAAMEKAGVTGPPQIWYTVKRAR